MKRVESETLKKEFKKIKNNLVIGLICIAITAICLGLLVYNEERVPKDTKHLSDVNNKTDAKANLTVIDKPFLFANYTNETNKAFYFIKDNSLNDNSESVYLNDIIESKELKIKENKKAHLKVVEKPFLFASFEGEEDRAFYIVLDEKFYYIAYMTNEEFEKLNTDDIKNNNQTINGITKVIPSDIKNLALEAFNEGLDKKDQINSSEFESYFGGVYLDTTISKPERYFIAYMTKSDFKKLNTDDIYKKNETIYGASKTVPSNIKKLALEAYNEGLDKNDQISSSEFETYFGAMYLDTTVNNNDVYSIILGLIMLISSICSVSFILVYIIRTLSTNSALKKISDDELSKIEKEIDASDAFYYEKAHLILTKNYIVSFTGKLYILNYKDAVWMYEHKLRQYGITTTKSLMIMNNLGKIRAILQVDGVTKKSSSIINEVAETIAEKNPNILIGYTKENQKQAREITKGNK